jgi:hypothetical protein
MWYIIVIGIVMTGITKNKIIAIFISSKMKNVIRVIAHPIYL